MKTSAVCLLIASLFLTNAAFADPPSGKGGGNKRDNAEWRDGKGKGKDRDRTDARRPDHGKGRADRDSGRQPRSSLNVHRHFADRHRAVVRDYYVTEYRSGHCPPGLAKKNNGCMPPGQAKKWKVGQPLARDIVYYEIPPALVVRIGKPPPGSRYVRVAADILLIAVGTGMVIDAIADLGSL